MVDAKEGKILTKEILAAIKLLNELAGNIGKMKFGSHQKITIEKKNIDFLDSDEVIQVEGKVEEDE